jgi:phosphate transport system substrate-binding protein
LTNHFHLIKINVIAFLLISFLPLGCRMKQPGEGEERRRVISIKGSDTMVNLAQKWAEVYMQKNKNISIQVTGGGSGTGIAALLNGTTDIAASSRELKSSEISSANSRGINPVEYEVALDGLALIVHPGNPINELSLLQVKNIFTGKMKNFKDAGGNDLSITLYGRENSSGTYEFFKEHVLNKADFTPSTQVLQGTAALGEAVARDRKGIGYGGVGYFAERNDVKILAIKNNDDDASISPVIGHNINYEVIWDGSYSISRSLFCYTDGEPKQEVKDFLDFIISAEGQTLVKEMEYIPLP